MVLSKVRSAGSAAMASSRPRACRSNSAAAGSTCAAPMASNGMRNWTVRSGFDWPLLGVMN